MTEAQCQATFQQNKSSIVTVHRRMCESALEKASLLTTRDMMVLQAFMLYLIGRRSEDKNTAAWALVALAVRLARAIGLDREPKKPANARESFFQQQMRLRLWLTVCLVDIQVSFAQSSEPLITHSDAACAIPTVAHINDSDLDVTTEHAAIASQEQLTDTTFALVTYHVQVAGRALNFGSPDCSTAAERHQLARQVQQQVFTLLHYCDPESSPYAWFTWHSTQSIVSAIRLSELLPFRGSLKPGSGASPPSPRGDGDLSLLRWALQNLEKAQLLCTDPRGSGFRWYITIPCLALSTAIAECHTCSDVETVRRA
ncbi:transcription factor vrtR2 [Aspergillus brasiliensis]|uniref:Transcription factor vrtR2 n=1 Tax=Aspergillus brasiliensis TaxID=319629 RepID=A0A9W6DK21_9EURO|nr:transcription factor vrtR2 [Aspergillus brasiliensis]GKZ45728.1 transcription factor vrtR2 [Aspergillus brasiliensis]